MPEARCVRYPIKPDRREALLDWIARLEGRSAEMTETMAESGLIAEAVFTESSDEGDYLVIYTSARNLAAATKALSVSQRPLVREFNQLLVETVDTKNAVALKFLYHTP